jgi:hypothetical protein
MSGLCRFLSLCRPFLPSRLLRFLPCLLLPFLPCLPRRRREPLPPLLLLLPLPPLREERLELLPLERFLGSCWGGCWGAGPPGGGGPAAAAAAAASATAGPAGAAGAGASPSESLLLDSRYACAASHRLRGERGCCGASCCCCSAKAPGTKLVLPLSQSWGAAGWPLPPPAPPSRSPDIVGSPGAGIGRRRGCVCGPAPGHGDCGDCGGCYAACCSMRGAGEAVRFEGQGLLLLGLKAMLLLLQ